MEVELKKRLEQYANVTDRAGRPAVVRNGLLPERDILTGLGPVTVRMPKVRDRSKSGITFHSAVVPPYVRADGIYSTLRGADDRLCLLVLIGVNARGEKRLLALSDGYRESKAAWLSILQDLQARGLTRGPALAVGDGALGFWAVK